MILKNTPKIYFEEPAFVALNSYLKSDYFSNLFVLVDSNTKIHCLPVLKKKLDFPFLEIEIQEGEQNKKLNTTEDIWMNLTELGADRQSILINLGGGVITDIGGFAASTFKRGIRFINIPTSLLAMVDAAIGGKTGVDFNGLKNQIGLFSNPDMVLIYPKFLETLPLRELKSGMAEVIKYGLIDNAKIWETIETVKMPNIQISTATIKKAIEVKERIVSEDPKEKGIRKILNFGHTLGHALETRFMSKSKNAQLLHGEAIAIGMIVALHLSYQILGFSLDKTKQMTKVILQFYNFKDIYLLPVISKNDLDHSIELMKHDKKSHKGVVYFILLKDFAKPILDCQVSKEQIYKAFIFYNELV